MGRGLQAGHAAAAGREGLEAGSPAGFQMAVGSGDGQAVYGDVRACHLYRGGQVADAEAAALRQAVARQSSAQQVLRLAVQETGHAQTALAQRDVAEVEAAPLSGKVRTLVEKRVRVQGEAVDGVGLLAQVHVGRVQGGLADGAVNAERVGRQGYRHAALPYLQTVCHDAPRRRLALRGVLLFARRYRDFDVAIVYFRVVYRDVALAKV